MASSQEGEFEVLVAEAERAHAGGPPYRRGRLVQEPPAWDYGDIVRSRFARALIVARKPGD